MFAAFFFLSSFIFFSSYSFFPKLEYKRYIRKEAAMKTNMTTIQQRHTSAISKNDSAPSWKSAYNKALVSDMIIF